MRVIRTSGFGNVVWVAFVSAQAADGVLTYLGLHTFGAGSEGNPIVAWYMAALGTGQALLGAKGLSVEGGSVRVEQATKIGRAHV